MPADYYRSVQRHGADGRAGGGGGAGAVKQGSVALPYGVYTVTVGYGGYWVYDSKNLYAL